MTPPNKWTPVRYTQTLLGSGVNSQGAAFPGGLDLTTPNLRLQPGALRDVLNFEVAPFGGYSRIHGYERVDGRASPSAADITIVQLDALAPAPAAGTVVTQATTGATATVVAAVAGPSPYLVLTQVSGIFDTSHALTTP